MNKKSSRAIGIVGTIARLILGVIFLSPLSHRQFQWYELLAGLIGVPLIILVIQRIRLIWDESPLQATGFTAFILNMVVFLALYLTPVYFPPIGFTSDIVLIFYGASMLLAAANGYAGCEVTAISNWILGRDDQVGCVIFSPIDAVEARLFNSDTN